MPPLGKLRVKKVYDVYTGKPLTFEGDGSVTSTTLTHILTGGFRDRCCL